MKRNRQKYGIALGLVALLCGCDSARTSLPQDGLMRLGARLDGMSETRGTLIGGLSKFEEMHTANGIGVWMYDTDGTALLSGTSFKPVSYAGSTVWMPETDIHWPEKATTLYAYAPLSASLEIDADGTFEYTVPESNESQPDLTVASSTVAANYPYSTDEGILPLGFKHTLSAVRFQTGADMVNGTFKSITIGDAYGKAVYDFATGQWSSHDAVTSFSLSSNVAVTFSTPESTPITKESQTFFMLPQTFAADGQYILIVFNDGIADHNLKIYLTELGTGWEAGKEYVYSVSLTTWEIIFSLSVEGDYSAITSCPFDTDDN